MSCPCHTCPDVIVCVCHTCPSVSHLPASVLVPVSSSPLDLCSFYHLISCHTCSDSIVSIGLVFILSSVHVTPVLILSSPLELCSSYHLCSCHTCSDFIVAIRVTTAVMSTSPCYTCSDAILSIHVRPVLMSSPLFMSDPF